MDPFKNGWTNQSIFYSQYAASWIVGSGQSEAFRKWLLQLGLYFEDVLKVKDFCTNGKLELEEDVKKFIEREGTP